MRLYLLRHAEAADIIPDAERPLTPKGRRDAEALGSLLRRQDARPPIEVWSSPYLRARQTAEALVAQAGWSVAVEPHEGLTPYDDSAALLSELAEHEDDLLIVGHNPHLAMLAGYLLGGVENRATVHFRKCALMRFDRVKRFSNDQEPTWVLSWMIPPKLFRPTGNAL